MPASSTSVPEHHAIAIIGAGLGGLMAARVLHRAGVDAAVFDLEGSRDARTQGGMLDIHTYNGQVAIRAAGLWDEFRALVFEGGEATRVLDRHATVLREETDNGEGDRPEVDRGALRALLLDALPSDMVRWGKKVVAVTRDTLQGPHRVEFADGSRITTDLLVGADGAWSKVRPFLTDAVPAYSGLSFVETDLLDADTRHPAEAAAVGAGMLFALGGRTGLLAHREPDGSLHVYLGHRADEHWARTLAAKAPEAAKEELLALLDGWAPALQGLVAHTDNELVPRPIFVMPVGITWARVPGVTLLGDAAHVMSPFAGEGANLAMLDGAELARHLLENPGDTEAALTAYEEELFPRSADAASESAQNLDIIFADDAPRGLVAMFESFDEAGREDRPATGHDA